MKRFFFVFPLLLILSTLGFYAPKDDFLDLLKRKVGLFNENRQREFVYLMLDKPFYKPGETIWFGAWVTEGNHLTATAQSQILRVDLIDPKGNVIENLKLPIIKGRSNGDFPLSKYRAGGIYKIRAYTSYSQNFDHYFEPRETFRFGTHKNVI